MLEIATFKNDMGKTVKEVNKILKRFCNQNGWGFIYHNGIAAYQHLKQPTTFEENWNLSFQSEFISFINGQ